MGLWLLRWSIPSKDKLIRDPFAGHPLLKRSQHMPEIDYVRPIHSLTLFILSSSDSVFQSGAPLSHPPIPHPKSSNPRFTTNNAANSSFYRDSVFRAFINWAKDNNVNDRSCSLLQIVTCSGASNSTSPSTFHTSSTTDFPDNFPSDCLTITFIS